MPHARPLVTRRSCCPPLLPLLPVALGRRSCLPLLFARGSCRLPRAPVLQKCPASAQQACRYFPPLSQRVFLHACSQRFEAGPLGPAAPVDGKVRTRTLRPLARAAPPPRHQSSSLSPLSGARERLLHIDAPACRKRAPSEHGRGEEQEQEAPPDSMASATAEFSAPPGHPAQAAALIVSSLTGVPVKIGAPDADLQDPVLKTNGSTITGTASILKHSACYSSSGPRACGFDWVPPPQCRSPWLCLRAWPVQSLLAQRSTRTQARCVQKRSIAVPHGSDEVALRAALTAAPPSCTRGRRQLWTRGWPTRRPRNRASRPGWSPLRARRAPTTRCAGLGAARPPWRR